MTNNTLISTVLPQVEAQESTWNTLASLGLQLRQHNQFLTLAFFVNKLTKKW